MSHDLPKYISIFLNGRLPPQKCHFGLFNEVDNSFPEFFGVDNGRLLEQSVVIRRLVVSRLFTIHRYG